MGEKPARNHQQVRREFDPGNPDRYFEEPTVPGYRIDHLTLALHPTESRSGVTRPESSWHGQAAIDDLMPFLVSFTVRSVRGTLLLDRLSLDYSPLLDSEPAEVPESPGQTLVDPLAAADDRTTPTEPPAITPAHLRKLSLPKLFEAIRYEAAARGLLSSSDEPDQRLLLDALKATADLYRPVKRKRIRRVGADQLRAAAELRLQLDAEGHPSPVAEMAEQLGYSVATLRDRLNRATDEGWLAPAARGARRRAPGPELIKAWAQEQIESPSGEEE